MASGLPDLSKQVGPLPLGAWVAVVGGGLAIAYTTSRSRSNVAPEAAIVTSADPNVGVGGMPAYTSTGNSTPLVAEEPIVDNEQWGRKAINLLLLDNYDALLVDSAVRKYLANAALSVSEAAVITQALRKLGSPPVPLPPPPDVITPVPSPTPVTPVAPTPQNPAPVADPQVGTRTRNDWSGPTHLVTPGDTLWGLAKGYLGSGARWPEIYNLNMDRISNPNRIYPGQWLRIPGGNWQSTTY